MIEHVREEWGHCYSFHLYRDDEEWYWGWYDDGEQLKGPYASEWDAIKAAKKIMSVD